MIWHGFGMYGQGGYATNPSEKGFSGRAKQLGVNIHDSPYESYQAGEIAELINKIPETEGVFVWGTSLGANNTPVVCSYAKRRIDGAFGFQASIYGACGVGLNANIKFAHLISSDNPAPFPGLGSYVWPLGTMPGASYHRTQHNLPHPGDYDTGDQDMFLAEMKRIMETTL